MTTACPEAGKQKCEKKNELINNKYIMVSRDASPTKGFEG